jgi:hypothetical protein
MWMWALIEICAADEFTVFQSGCEPKKDWLSKAMEMLRAPQSKSYSINYSLIGLSRTYLAQTTENPWSDMQN